MGAGSLLTWWCVDVPPAVHAGSHDDQSVASARAIASIEDPAASAGTDAGGDGAPIGSLDRKDDAPAPRGPVAVGEPEAAPPPEGEAIAGSRDGEAITQGDAIGSAPREGEAVASASPGEAPPLPLPRMPGATRLSESARFDDAAGVWVRKAAFRVHAREHHVLAFYHKALENEGLAVTEGEDPPDADGGVRRYLHGRSRRVTAQVGVRTRVGALETRVWILWRQRP